MGSSAMSRILDAKVYKLNSRAPPGTGGPTID
jgi:hypothetical protein